MNKHIEDFRKAVAAGTPVEAVARIYGLSKGPGESEAELKARLELLLETAPSRSLALLYMDHWQTRKERCVIHDLANPCAECLKSDDALYYSHIERMQQPFINRVDKLRAMVQRAVFVSRRRSRRPAVFSANGGC